MTPHIEVGPIRITHLSEVESIFSGPTDAKEGGSVGRWNASQYELDGFLIVFKPYVNRTEPPRKQILEVVIEKGPHKIMLWLITDGWRNIHDIRIFGFTENPDSNWKWASTQLSDAFEPYLKLAHTMLQIVFNRIECVKPTEHTRQLLYEYNPYKETFMQNVGQPCNLKIRTILSSYIRHRRLIRTFRREQHVKRAWYAWIDHYYSPNTQFGFMQKKLRIYA